MLCRGHLVVLCLCRNAKLPEFLVNRLHVSTDTLTDDTKVMVVQLLALGRLCAEQRPAGVDQIVALVVHGLINKEVLLLRADGGGHALHVAVAEQLQNPEGLLVQGLHAVQQRRLLVQYP